MDNGITSEKLFKIVEIVGLENEISQGDFAKEIDAIAQDMYAAPLKEVALDQIKFLLHEWLIKKNKMFIMDWKWEPEDLIGGIQTLLPDFEYTEPIEEKENPDAVVYETLNPILEEKYGMDLVGINTEGDSYGYLLFKKGKLTGTDDYPYLSFS